MTPKEYAEELVIEMYNAQDEKLRWMPDAVNCAKVAVRRIIKSHVIWETCSLNQTLNFYKKVLTELNKM